VDDVGAGNHGYVKLADSCVCANLFHLVFIESNSLRGRSTVFVQCASPHPPPLIFYSRPITSNFSGSRIVSVFLVFFKVYLCLVVFLCTAFRLVYLWTTFLIVL